MNGKIITANDWFRMGFMHNRRGRMLKAMRFHGLPGDYGISKEDPLRAFVNRGKWLVICPECGGGEKVWEEGLMMCHHCFNSAVGHQLRQTVFPKSREKIEALLLKRPLDGRNWELNESIKKLEQENKDNASKLLPERGG